MKTQGSSKSAHSHLSREEGGLSQFNLQHTFFDNDLIFQSLMILGNLLGRPIMNGLSKGNH